MTRRTIIGKGTQKPAQQRKGKTSVRSHEIKRMKLAALRPADYNPRQISAEALAGLGASMDRFGLVQPIVWNRETKNVVGGHQRLKVLEARNITEVDVVVVDLPLAEERALNVALNNPAIAGEFTEALEGLLESIQGETPDLYADLLLTDLEGLVKKGGFRPGEGYIKDGIEEWRDAKGFFTCPKAVRKQFEKRSTVVVEYSGGKDSQAALLWTRTVFPGKKTYAVFVDPGVEFPGMGAHIHEAAAFFRAEPVIVKPEDEWWSWLALRGEWPSMLYRPCAMHMIHEPWAAWAKQHTQPADTVVITGSRAEEAVRGSKKTATSPLATLGKDGGKYFHFAPCFNVKKPVLEACLDKSACPLWPGYAMGFVRTACWCCMGQSGEQAVALQKNFPGLADEIRRWEQRIGPLRPLEGRTFDDVLRAGVERIARAQKKAAPTAKAKGAAKKRKKPVRRAKP